MNDLKTIPGVGPKLSAKLVKIGVHSVGDLVNADPQELYDTLCRLEGIHIDRCVLYVFRCAVYFASNKTHNPELLKWWNWK